MLQWPKVLEDKEKVTRFAIFGSHKYLPSQKYVRMIKNISFIYLCFIYGLQLDKRQKIPIEDHLFFFKSSYGKELPLKLHKKKIHKTQHWLGQSELVATNAPVGRFI